MTDAIIVLCTFANQQDAERIGSAVIVERLAACVNIFPAVQSIYRWKGEIERAEETLVLIKTTRESFSALRDRIKELHPYETPEIIAVPVVEGSREYLTWIGEQVR
jgi:periplasmic divalent cation tolerance protein